MYIESVPPIDVFHCDVLKWNKSIKNSFIENFNNFFKQDIYCFMEPTNIKLKKFASMLGFKHYKDFVGLDNVSYSLFLRRQ